MKVSSIYRENLSKNLETYFLLMDGVKVKKVHLWPQKWPNRLILRFRRWNWITERIYAPTWQPWSNFQKIQPHEPSTPIIGSSWGPYTCAQLCRLGYGFIGFWGPWDAFYNVKWRKIWVILGFKWPPLGICIYFDYRNLEGIIYWKEAPMVICCYFFIEKLIWCFFFLVCIACFSRNKACNIFKQCC
jgi:hypothetical protein